MKKLILFVLAFISIFSNFVAGRDYTKSLFQAQCTRPIKQFDLSVNNVRARLSASGNLFSVAAYVVPNPAPGQVAVSSIYSAGLWIGGIDVANNLKFSGITYGALGNDFFSGPLDINGTTESTICNQWDRIFTVKGNEIEQHISAFEAAKLAGINFDCSSIPDGIKYWPAYGNPYFIEKYNWELPAQPLADFWDENDDDHYNPCDGDYPIVNQRGCDVGYQQGTTIPTEINFFIINDNGGPQTFSGPGAIQLELQVSAFAYSTNDELNDMTFYQYKMINKSAGDLQDSYFGFWVDPDLGCYADDYIGSDPDHNLAYVYNQDNIDGMNGSICAATNTYGEGDIPMLSFSFIEGPQVVKIFKRDVDGNFLRDSNGFKIMIDPPFLSGQVDTFIEGKMSVIRIQKTTNRITRYKFIMF